MKDNQAKNSVFQFEQYDPSIQECRPLVDPLPCLADKKTFKPKRVSQTLQGRDHPRDAWNGNSQICAPASNLLSKVDCKNEIPAGSPSFARRPILNGHFQRGDQFKPSIRINQPPGGFDRIDW